MNNKAALLKFYEQFPEMNFDLKQLTTFNPALVYGFDYEGALIPEAQDSDRGEYIIHNCAQFLDVLDAYLYEQQDIVPKIKANGCKDVTEADVLTCLDQIHLRMARMLAMDATAAGQEGAIAGEPCKRVLLHWHAGYEIHNYIVGYLKDKLLLAKLIEFGERVGIAAQTMVDFVKLLQREGKAKVNEILESERSYAGPDDSLEIIRLVTHYYNNELSEEQKDLVGKFMIIFSPPEQRAELRAKFAKEWLLKLKQTDANNLDQVVDLAFWTFYQITKGHWYFNANGRTATCFMNAILCALGKPSILLRYPNERDDPKSSYNQAIKYIDTKPELLKQHIKQRILDHQANGGYRNEDLAKVVACRIRLAKIRAKLLHYFPVCDTKQFNEKLEESNASFMKKCAQMGQQGIVTFVEKVYIKEFTELFERLKGERIKKIIEQYKLADSSALFQSFDQTILNKALRTAAASGHITNVKFLVKVANCDINQKDDGSFERTPLHWAIVKGHTKVVQFLQECKAQTDLPDKSGETALMAAKNSSAEIKKLLGVVDEAVAAVSQHTVNYPQ